MGKRNLISQFKKSLIAKRTFAWANSIDESTLRLWLKKDLLQPKFIHIDKQVLEWVQLRNYSGIRVKDAFICSEAKRVRGKLIEEAEDADDKDSHFSNFKLRRCGCIALKFAID